MAGYSYVPVYYWFGSGGLRSGISQWKLEQPQRYAGNWRFLGYIANWPDVPLKRFYYALQWRTMKPVLRFIDGENPPRKHIKKQLIQLDGGRLQRAGICFLAKVIYWYRVSKETNWVKNIQKHDCL